jgi:hypothetical protein
MRRFWLSVIAAAMLAVPPLHADVWDTASDSDDNTGTDNVPIHGTVQVHDLGARPGPLADEDFYAISAAARTSYEAVIEGLTGDVGGALEFDWVALDGTTVLASGVFLGSASCTSCTQSARFNNAGVNPAPVFIRIGEALCATTCNADDQYTFRLYETTYSIPRFNNGGSQTTVLLVQNTADYAVNASVHFYNAAGTFLGTSSHAIAARATLVLPTATLGFAAGVSGSITISNDGRYGDLSGKAVALEPSTGFTFDTIMVPKPL